MNTNPQTPGAPLEPGTPIVDPAPGPMLAELTRAKVELMYAIAMHRKSWARMRAHAEARDERAGQIGMLSTLESDPHWKKATGDVAWWRGEMDAQANVVLALTKLLGAHPSLPGWAEVTSFRDTAAGTRTFVPRGTPRDTNPMASAGTVRTTVMGWDEDFPPTKEQATAAALWWKHSNRQPTNDNGKCERLIDRWNETRA